MPKLDPVPARQIARLERAAVILDRFHIELHALAPSARATRLIRANRQAAAALQQRAEKARRKLQDTSEEPRSASAPPSKPQPRVR